jgi:hypothetical protein
MSVKSAHAGLLAVVALAAAAFAATTAGLVQPPDVEAL